MKSLVDVLMFGCFGILFVVLFVEFFVEVGECYGVIFFVEGVGEK